METKRCCRCGKVKSVNQFAQCLITMDRLSDYCGACDDWSVYILVDPRDSRIYYVGCSQSPKIRLTQHIAMARSEPKANPRKAEWLNNLWRCGFRPLMIEIECVNYWHHLEREFHWIVTLAENGAPLTNARHGHHRQYFVDLIAENKPLRRQLPLPLKLRK